MNTNPHQGNCTPSSSSSPPAPSASEPRSTNFAFLVHSQNTILYNLPPGVDNRPLVRQRRRRTSPEDHAVLETEFQHCSKPDKAARQSILERVALGEKEIQVLNPSPLSRNSLNCLQMIWFQNRRQNSRRKSRPVLPHEIQPPLHASQTSRPDIALNLTVSPNVAQTVSEAPREVPTSFILSGVTPAHSESDQTSIGIERWSLPVSQTSNESFTSREQYGSMDDLQAKGSLPSIGTESNTATREEQVVTKTPHDRESVQNRMCHSKVHLEEVKDRQDGPSTGSAFAVGGESRAQEFLTAAETQTTINAIDAKQSPASLERAPSKVRLSMASDGSAKVVTGDESSPSPPRSQPVPPLPMMTSKGLRRSYSAAGLNDVFSSNGSENSCPGLRRAPSGRSRDYRAWEFWCDGDAQNDLAKKADQEQSGSAADAISCMRFSSRGTLTPNINKTNLRLLKQSSAKRVKNDHLLNPRPALGRAKSSVARLQGGARDVGPVYIIENEVHKDQSKKPSIHGVDVSSGDSDKENREPETQNLSNGRRTATQSQVTGRTRRPILGDNRTVPRQNSSCGSPRRERGEKSKKGPVRNSGLEKENLDPEDDEELVTFMSGCPNGERASISGEDDLNCVQGLLSLSQGNWK